MSALPRHGTRHHHHGGHGHHHGGHGHGHGHHHHVNAHATAHARAAEAKRLAAENARMDKAITASTRNWQKRDSLLSTISQAQKFWGHPDVRASFIHLMQHESGGRDVTSSNGSSHGFAQLHHRTAAIYAGRYGSHVMTDIKAHGQIPSPNNLTPAQQQNVYLGYKIWQEAVTATHGNIPLARAYYTQPTLAKAMMTAIKNGDVNATAAQLGRKAGLASEQYADNPSVFGPNGSWTVRQVIDHISDSKGKYDQNFKVAMTDKERSLAEGLLTQTAPVAIKKTATATPIAVPKNAVTAAP